MSAIRRQKTAPPSSAVDRRALLRGAAWTVPAVAAATIAPVAAASKAAPLVQLAFDQSAYTGIHCSTITGAFVTLTTDGIPTAGRNVTISVSAGFAFSGGAVTYTGVSGSDGRVHLPPITIPTAGGTGTITATSLDAQVSSALVAPLSAVARYYNGSSGASGSWTSVPATAKPIGGWKFFLDGTDIYYGNTIVATGVSAAVGGSGNVVDHVNYIQNGTARTWSNPGGDVAFSQIPPNATPLKGSGTFLAGTDLYFGDALIASHVSAATAVSAYDAEILTYIQNGVAKGYSYFADEMSLSTWSETMWSGYTTWPTLPSTATPVGGAGFFLAGTNLYYRESLIATGVARAVGSSGNGADYVNFVQNGVVSTWAKPYQSVGEVTTFPGVPSDATLLDAQGTFLSGTDLYLRNSRLASGVTGAASGSIYGGDILIFVSPQPCP